MLRITLLILALAGSIAAWAATGGVLFLVAAALFLVSASAGLGKLMNEQPQRPALTEGHCLRCGRDGTIRWSKARNVWVCLACEGLSRPAGPGWYWNRALSSWCRKPEHATEPLIEDEFDAAVAAWKTVYGEDIGYNEHAATLAKLGAWHAANELSSDQLVDCSDAVEWVTWALAQPEQKMFTFEQREGRRRKLSHLLDDPNLRKLECGCSMTSRNHNCRHVRAEGGHRTLEQITRQLADLETRAANALAAQDLQQRRDLFDQYEYAKAVERFTRIARPSGFVVENDKRMSDDEFKRLRAQYQAKRHDRRLAVLESNIHTTCNGCASILYPTGASGAWGEHRYCDGSHTLIEGNAVEFTPSTGGGTNEAQGH